MEKKTTGGFASLKSVDGPDLDARRQALRRSARTCML